MYQVLARKYRPGIFDEIIGQDAIVQTLKNAVINDRLSHAYIFTGTRGVGKTSIARILAKSINCENGPTANPCGVCSACVQIQNGNSVDVIEIDGASNTGVDSVRELKENIIYSPQSLRFKIYIIDEVHMLSNSAFNALLKTLEEPPAHAKFIFATTEIHKVPETILSRCQRFNFKRIPTKIIFEKLKDIAKAENINAADENLMIIASLADGSLRDSLSIFDTVISYFGNDIKEDVSGVLGLTSKSITSKLVSSIFNKDYEGALKAVKEIYDSGADLRQFMKQAAHYIRNIIIVKLRYKDLIYDLTDEEIKTIEPLAEQKSLEELLDMLDVMINADVKFQRISSPLLMMELTIFRLFNVPDKKNVTELILKIDALKDQTKHTPGTAESLKPHNIITLETKSAEKQNTIINNRLNEERYAHAKPAEPAEKFEQTEPKKDSGQLLEHEKLFEHFSKMDEKLNEKEKITKPKNFQTEEPAAEEPQQKDFQKNSAEKTVTGDKIIESIKEVFGDSIKRIDKI
jgi:DNA polymerase-3 subunit gamma/tau